MIRLFVPDALAAGAEIAPTADQARYLTTVMRLGVGDGLLLFNGRDGEWRARLATVSKRGCTLAVEDRTRAQAAPPDLDLVVALVKRARLETIVEKAAELGARRVRLLADWEPGRRLMFCDEAGDDPAEAWGGDQGRARPALAALADGPEGPWAVLVGPEGGFAPEERARLRALPFVTPVTLGPRILRADTAAISALTLWQAARGDWR